MAKPLSVASFALFLAFSTPGALAGEAPAAGAAEAFAAPPSPAAERSPLGPLHELEGSAALTAQFQSGLDMRINLSAAYGHLVATNFQATAAAYVIIQGATSLVQLLAGPTFNFPLLPGRLDGAFYFTLRGGFSLYSTGGASSSAFAFSLETGKRFPLADWVSWKPALRVSGVTSTGADPVILLIPVQFSFFL